MISDYDKEHMAEIIFSGQGTWFTAHLLRLMHKADSVNFKKLQKVFPEEAAAYIKWYTQGE